MAQNPNWDLVPSDRIIVGKKNKKLFHNPLNSSELTGTFEVIVQEQRIAYNHVINKEDLCVS